MITPQEIRDRARKIWSTGEPLRAALAERTVMAEGVASAATEALSRDDAFFPYAIPFRKPGAREWLDRFAELRAAVAQLEAESKAGCGSGYVVEIREMAHQKLGRLRVPERVAFECVEDLAACAGEARSLRRFLEVAERIGAREPKLLEWIAERPLLALECEAVLSPLLETAAYFKSNPRPLRFARELGIPGVDSKFIEAHRAVLAEWFDRLLPAEAIDPSVRGLSDRGFERRYGLRYEEPAIRFRWLDPARALAARISDATVPLTEFAAYAPECSHVIITENKINFLTLPACRGGLALFGSGYAIDLLRSVPWLDRQPLHYWGDLDTHGFAILSRLRAMWPHTRSFLMDRDTLLAHRELWTEEPIESRCLRDLAALDDAETVLYDDLRHDRLGERVRLEQERIVIASVQAAVRGIEE